MPTEYHTSQPTFIPHTSGIYKIVCLANKKFYIGSTVNLHKRWLDHQRDLFHQAHANQKLQRAYQKYGADTFQFEIIEFVLPPFLKEREQYYLDKYKPFGSKGFNIARQAANPLLGLERPPISEETREKLRISHIGQPGYWAGKKRPPETVAKMNGNRLGKPSPRYPGYTHSPEHREKLRWANLGKKASEETKRKLREKRKDRVISPESIEKTRLANTGRKNSKEAIERMRDVKVKDMKTFIATDPNGVEHIVTGIHRFCEEHHLDRRCVQRVASGKLSQHKGWKIRYLDNDVA